MQIDFMKELKLDERELQSRRAFFQITDDDLRRLASMRPIAEKHAEAVIEGLYELILGHPESRALFPDETVIRRVKGMQRQYFTGLFSGVCDLKYVENRLLVGATHERLGIAPKWYIGAYSRYLGLLLERVIPELPQHEQMKAYLSLQKMVAFDKALAIDTYIAAGVQTLARHQSAIRELSTPVIRVYSGVLLLPLVGTIDTHRAEQIMEKLLTRVVEEQARALIIDIAGVAVVDTKVADHLLKTTEAVRLLGATTILTGISAQVARTIVQLGVDISAMHTRAKLADGIELALGLMGKKIGAKHEEK